MTLMLSAIMTIENPRSLINNDVLIWRQKILITTISLYFASIILQIVYYKLHPWSLKNPTPLEPFTALFKSLKDIKQLFSDTCYQRLCCNKGRLGCLAQGVTFAVVLKVLYDVIQMLFIYGFDTILTIRLFRFVKIEY